MSEAKQFNLYVMVDIETLSLNSSSSSIVQIGGAIVGGNAGFSNYIGRKQDPVLCDMDTIMWWMDQSEEVRSQVFSSTLARVKLPQALHNLSNFVNLERRVIEDQNRSLKVGSKEPEVTTYLVGHGFDLTFIKVALEKHKRNLPFHYRNWLDLRSFEHIARIKGYEFDIPEVHPKHNAASDAKWQALWLEKFFVKEGISYHAGRLQHP